MGKNILFIGATGYIGSTVLDRILKVAPDASISVLVRNPKAPGFESIHKRLKTVKGSLEELDKLTALAAEADIIINTADADGLESTMALLAGAKQRKEKTGETTILIHTSGTGTLSDVSQLFNFSDTSTRKVTKPGRQSTPTQKQTPPRTQHTTPSLH